MAYELGKLEISEFFKKEIPNIQIPVVHSDPRLGLKDLQKLKQVNWDLVIGLSMGGVYATKIKSKKTVLINPGFGISEGIKTKFPEYSLGFKELENLPDQATNVLGFISMEDKLRSVTEPIFVRKYGKNSLINIPGKHVPTIEELSNYIIPEIRKFAKL